VRHVPAEEVFEAKKSKNYWLIEDPFVRWLWLEDLGLTHGGPKYVLCFEKRMTKANKMMATAVLSNQDREIEKVLVFPKQFGKAYGKVKPGDTVDARFKKLEDGDLMLTEVRA
jgi:hypothetical protein